MQLILAHRYGPALQGHPMIAILQAVTHAAPAGRFQEDLDWLIEPALTPERIADELLELLCDTG